MNKKFINFTNHPSTAWDKNQTSVALTYGELLDIPFPNVPPHLTSDELATLGEEYAEKIINNNPAAVLCQGEFSLAYNVITRLKQKGIPVLAACSERNTTIVGNEKRSIFSFVRFREYI